MRKLIVWLVFLYLSIGCQPANTESANDPPAQIEESPPVRNEPATQQSLSLEEVPQKIEVDQQIDERSDCDFEDGIHEASVGYYNPDTGHTATYDLKVHIANCAVIRIDFPNGGWLDEDHIQPTALDKKGKAKLTDDKGRRWEVLMTQIERQNTFNLGNISR